ncbi:hypothetical protein [Candidatus Collinsella stercoripullorum]|uniref:hypothetical protein n=1 Tax=Candidatus Collinsella stercoripullorum TaxID=2838522 RepID=UPI0022DF1144|nr:hypothetical protein [Candidatus Collinsella stercoripullorum]
MTNEERTREQLASHAKRMRRCAGCTVGEIARALELTVHETRKLLKEGRCSDS